MTLGIELPLDNDFAHTRKTPGVPDIEKHHERAVLTDALGFRAIWMRDVPLWPPTCCRTGSAITLGRSAF